MVKLAGYWWLSVFGLLESCRDRLLVYGGCVLAFVLLVGWKAVVENEAVCSGTVGKALTV